MFQWTENSVNRKQIIQKTLLQEIHVNKMIAYILMGSVSNDSRDFPKCSEVES